MKPLFKFKNSLPPTDEALKDIQAWLNQFTQLPPAHLPELIYLHLQEDWGNLEAINKFSDLTAATIILETKYKYNSKLHKNIIRYKQLLHVDLSELSTSALLVQLACTRLSTPLGFTQFVNTIDNIEEIKITLQTYLTIQDTEQVNIIKVTSKQDLLTKILGIIIDGTHNDYVKFKLLETTDEA